MDCYMMIFGSWWIHTNFGVSNITLQVVQLSLGKTCYSIHSSCCSTDLESHPKWMIFIWSERSYVTFCWWLVVIWPYLSPFLTYGQFSLKNAHFSYRLHSTPNLKMFFIALHPQILLAKSLDIGQFSPKVSLSQDTFVTDPDGRTTIVPKRAAARQKTSV